MATIDTTIESYRKIGIPITDEQYQKLIYINMIAQGNDNKDIPVHFILMTLKALDLIPTKQMSKVCNDKPADNAENICNDELEQIVGVFKQK